MNTPPAKRFLKLPEYPGGNKAFKEFILKNLRYPEAAIKHAIQGSVYLEYEVTDNGRVENAVVTAGLGYGCDEEAMRLIGLLKYGKVKNRGMRVKSKVKTRIDFRLPQPVQAAVQFSYTQTSKETKKPAGPNAYNYTIPLD
jgi:TonB family protein